MDEMIVIPEGKTVVLNLAGKTITGSAQNVIYSEGDLTITGTGKITATKAGYNYAIRAQKGTVVIDGNIAVEGTFGCVEIYNGSDVTINNGSYNATGINGMTSHTVYVKDSTLTVNGGTFDSGYSSEGIDTICGSGSATVALNGGTFYASELGASFFLKGNIVAKGGTYQYDPAQFVYGDYMSKANGDGTYSVVLKPAATVGNTTYETMEEAIAAWTNNSALTLLRNVTLTDVIKLKSTEHHILNLGTYTLTAASGKNAIEITCEGLSGATYALTVNADATNPGGITANGKSCIYYRKSGTTKDRPIIAINGGVFNGSYAVNVYSSNRGTNCPQVNIAGGTFNGNVNIGHGKLMASGGTFNGWVNCTGDSTAYRQISGGTYKSWLFMTADANNKFWVGTSQANYNVGVYVDDNGYLVVGGPVITEAGDKFAASSTNYSGWSSYLKYSSAAANGLYYTSVKEAMADNNKTSGVVTVYTDSIDMTGITYKGTLKITDTLTVTFTEGATVSWSVAADGKTVSYTESVSNGVVTRIYTLA